MTVTNDSRDVVRGARSCGRANERHCISERRARQKLSEGDLPGERDCYSSASGGWRLLSEGGAPTMSERGQRGKAEDENEEKGGTAMRRQNDVTAIDAPRSGSAPARSR